MGPERVRVFVCLLSRDVVFVWHIPVFVSYLTSQISYLIPVCPKIYQNRPEIIHPNRCMHCTFVRSIFKNGAVWGLASQAGA